MTEDARVPPGGQRPPSLWRHRDFLLLWAGQSVSELGSAVTLVAAPLVAVVLLRATTFQIGLLAAAATVPFLLIALPAGLVVDRLARRRLMIACDIGRMLVIGSVPVAAALGALTLAQLFAVALLAGILTVFFDVAYQSYVPSLVTRQQLADGNGKLAATQAFAQVAGPGLGGALYGLLRAGAMTADALSYAASSAAMLAIRAREPAGRPPITQRAARSLRAELLAGLVFIARHPILRKIAACTATANLFLSMAMALEVVFMIRVLHVRPEYAGTLLAIGSLGGVAGGIVSGALTRLIGSARVIWVSLLGFGVLGLLLPLAEPGWRVALIPAGLFAVSFAGVLYNIAQLSFRQSICPPELLGRLNAAIRWLVWGTLPLGGIAGGALGTLAGIRPTLWIGVTGSWLAGLWVLFSPLRTMRDVPGPDPGPADTPPPDLGLADLA
jgi:Na+/melibiose symporter-like transporter